MESISYQEIVSKLGDRLVEMLAREATVGHSMVIRGASRIKPDELHGRLENLRDQVQITCETLLNFTNLYPKKFEAAIIRRLLRPARKALQRPQFKGMHASTLSKELQNLWYSLDDALGLFRPSIVKLSERIRPDGLLHRLTGDEVEALYDGDRDAVLLAECLRVEAKLDQCIAEVYRLLANEYGWRPLPSGGRYEKARGRYFAAQIIGMGVGLGLSPTRSNSSPATSACDAAVDACDAKRETLRPISPTVFHEIPTGYDGMEHIWTNRQRRKDIGSAVATGSVLGARMLQNKPKPLS